MTGILGRGSENASVDASRLPSAFEQCQMANRRDDSPAGSSLAAPFAGLCAVLLYYSYRHET